MNDIHVAVRYVIGELPGWRVYVYSPPEGHSIQTYFKMFGENSPTAAQIGFVVVDALESWSNA